MSRFKVSTQFENGSIPAKIKLNDPRLKIHPDYQRLLDQGWVRKIQENFDRTLLEPVKISFREGTCWIVNGQHTIEAMIKMGYTHFDAMVWTDLTEQQEAKMFFRGNRDKKNLTGIYMIRAAAIAKDPHVIATISILENAGFKTAVSLKDPCCYIDRKHNEFDFHKSLVTCVEQFRRGERACESVQKNPFRRLIKGYEAWKVQGEYLSDIATQTGVIRGLCTFVHNHCYNESLKDIKTIFSMTTPEKVHGLAVELMAKENACRSDKFFVPAMCRLTISKRNRQISRQQHKKAA